MLASTSVLAQNPPPSGGDPPFVPPAVNRATLNDLYKSTGGPQWKVSTGWGTDSDYCTWYGVTCVYTNHNITTHIRLAQNNLVGTIPDNIGDLADLKVIDLSGNAISGTIPESLSKFFFYNIKISNPAPPCPHIANRPSFCFCCTCFPRCLPFAGTISTMVDINFSGNKLTGPLPEYIYNQKVNVTYPIGTTLRSINLEYNSITGPIPETWFGPPKVGTFPPPNNLQVVNMRYNQITGDIPTSISTAFKLDTLLLSYNKMSGNITDTLLDTWLGTRKYCDLSGNSWGTVSPAVSKTCNM